MVSNTHKAFMGAAVLDIWTGVDSSLYWHIHFFWCSVRIIHQAQNFFWHSFAIHFKSHR
jgi:hypothetical protein